MKTEKRQVSIVGSGYYPGAGNCIERLGPGQLLSVLRQPDNPADANAIAVYYFNQMLGHVPRGFAAEVAPLVDAGAMIKCWKSRDPRFAGSAVMVFEWEIEE